jgi:hypothetical protein
MQTPDSIEAALSRLMPPALSTAGQRSIEAMLDDLAATAVVAKPSARRRMYRYLAPAGIAAALLVGAGTAFRQLPSSPAFAGEPAVVSALDEGDGIVLISESNRVETLSDEGWLGTPEGGAMQAVRSRVVEANTFRDEETGIEVVVSEPREETILMPVSVF